MESVRQEAAYSCHLCPMTLCPRRAAGCRSPVKHHLNLSINFEVKVRTREDVEERGMRNWEEEQDQVGVHHPAKRQRQPGVRSGRTEAAVSH